MIEPFGFRPPGTEVTLDLPDFPDAATERSEKIHGPEEAGVYEDPHDRAVVDRCHRVLGEAGRSLPHRLRLDARRLAPRRRTPAARSQPPLMCRRRSGRPRTGHASGLYSFQSISFPCLQKYCRAEHPAAWRTPRPGRLEKTCHSVSFVGLSCDGLSGSCATACCCGTRP